MFDFQFDWDDSISVGVEEIDRQHQQYFRIGRDLEQLILTNCGGADDQQILDTLCEIRDYMTYHFYTEEKILLENNSIYLGEHKAQHEEFMKVINAVDCEELLKNPTAELKKLRTFLQQWFFTHILQEDKKCFQVKHK